MRFRDLEIPMEVVDAHREGNLVFFIGAGVSMGAPSNLPNFNELVKQISLDSPDPCIRKFNPDKALGELEFLYGIDVHSRVAKILSNPKSEPNQMHHAIARLVKSSPKPRIVTTNFDTHLTSALKSEGIPVPEYVGPAVPIGDDFEGLVYLHSNLQKSPSRLVLTDQDFGAAYLRDGWATRFLDRMFSRYSVLYIGYSHKDIMMQYLAKGLRDHKPRFIISNNGSRGDFERLGLYYIPVDSEVEELGYEKICNGLHRWADRESSGLLDIDTRVAEIVSGPPPLSPEDEDFLEEVLGGDVLVTLLIEKLVNVAWIDWIATKAIFKSIFVVSDQLETSAQKIAEWFGRWALLCEENSLKALELIHNAGGHLSIPLWFSIAQTLHSREGLRLKWHEPWILLLIDNDPGLDRNYLSWAIEKTDWTDSAGPGLRLIEHLTKPYIVGGFNWNGQQNYELDIRGDDYWLDEARTSKLHKHLPKIAATLALIGASNLKHAYLLNSLYNVGDSKIDYMSFRRSSIATHPQDKYRNSLDAIIDLTRDSALQLVKENSFLVEHLVLDWAKSESVLLRRIAVYVQTCRTNLTADQKLLWILEENFLLEIQLHHEVFMLLKDNSAQASEQVTNRIIRSALDSDSNFESHAIFVMLTWLKMHGVELRVLIEALADYQRLHPEWNVPDHLEMLHWTEGGFIENKPQVTLEEFKNKLEDSATESLEFIQSFQSKIWPVSELTWNDALSLVQKLASTYPSSSILLANVLSENEKDIQEALVYGWQESKVLDESLTSSIIPFLKKWSSNIPNAITRLLVTRDTGKFIGWWKIPATYDVAYECWNSIANLEEVDFQDDLVMAAINSSAGRLADYWIFVLQEERRNSADSWKGIQGQIQESLERMISDPGLSGKLACIVLCGQVRFLDAVDHKWTNHNILPLLNLNSQESNSISNWSGFLTFGYWTEALLQSGLLQMYEEASMKYKEFSGRREMQLPLHLASIILRAEIIENRLGCAIRWSAKVSEELRISVLESIGRLLKDSTSAEKDAAWKSWIKSYWEQRLDGSPIPLTLQEGRALLDLITLFQNDFEEAAILAISTPIVFNKNSHLLTNLNDAVVLEHGDLVCQLMIHILKNNQGELWIFCRLHNLFDLFKDSCSKERILEFREAAIAAGISDARFW